MFLVGAGGLIYILVKDPTQVGLAAIFAGVCIGGVGAGKLRQNGDDRKEDT
jgi:hypothetical protein